MARGLSRAPSSDMRNQRVLGLGRPSLIATHRGARPRDAKSCVVARDQTSQLRSAATDAGFGLLASHHGRSIDCRRNCRADNIISAFEIGVASTRSVCGGPTRPPDVGSQPLCTHRRQLGCLLCWLAGKHVCIGELGLQRREATPLDTSQLKDQRATLPPQEVHPAVWAMFRGLCAQEAGEMPELAGPHLHNGSRASGGGSRCKSSDSPRGVCRFLEDIGRR